ncbi:hypothetical protein, partial [Enterobacter hormaechei]
HQGAYRPAGLNLARPTGFVGPVMDTGTGQTYKNPLINAFYHSPRAGKQTVNFRLLHINGEDLGKKIGWGVAVYYKNLKLPTN